MRARMRSQMQRGFTLFEVLVVLVIMGVVGSLALSLMTQFRSSVQRLLPASQQYHRLEVRSAFLTRTFESFIPARTAAESFAGDKSQLFGLATYFPGHAWPAERLVRLSLATAEAQAIVVAEELTPDRTRARERMEVMRLDCDEPVLAYLDAELKWRDAWRQGTTPPFLPLAIRLSCSRGTQEMHLVGAVEREGLLSFGDRVPLGSTR